MAERKPESMTRPDGIYDPPGSEEAEQGPESMPEVPEEGAAPDGDGPSSADNGTFAGESVPVTPEEEPDPEDIFPDDGGLFPDGEDLVSEAYGEEEPESEEEAPSENGKKNDGIPPEGKAQEQADTSQSVPPEQPAEGEEEEELEEDFENADTEKIMETVGERLKKTGPLEMEVGGQTLRIEPPVPDKFKDREGPEDGYKIPPLRMYINNRQVNKNEFMTYINEHKVEFMNAFARAYNAKIAEMSREAPSGKVMEERNAELAEHLRQVADGETAPAALSPQTLEKYKDPKSGRKYPERFKRPSQDIKEGREKTHGENSDSEKQWKSKENEFLNGIAQRALVDQAEKQQMRTFENKVITPAIRDGILPVKLPGNGTIEVQKYIDKEGKQRLSYAFRSDEGIPGRKYHYSQNFGGMLKDSPELREYFYQACAEKSHSAVEDLRSLGEDIIEGRYQDSDRTDGERINRRQAPGMMEDEGIDTDPREAARAAAAKADSAARKHDRGTAGKNIRSKNGNTNRTDRGGDER